MTREQPLRHPLSQRDCSNLFARKTPGADSDSGLVPHLLDSSVRNGGAMLFDKEVWKAQCRENARSLETEINRLKSDYCDLLGLFWRRYDEFWVHARRISAMFKQPLLREDRERLWAAYSLTCHETRKAQAREYEARRGDSREKRDLVMSKIREAYFQAREAADSDKLAEADALLNEALAWMKNGWEGLNTV